MTTMRETIANARRSVYGSLPDKMNLIATAYDAGDTEVYLGMDVQGIKPGTILCSGLNVWFVRELDVTTKVATVLQFDDSPSSDCAVNDIVYAAPRITDWYLFTKAVDCIKSLSTPNNGLYRIIEWDAYVDPVWGTYEVPSGATAMQGLLEVKLWLPGSNDTWATIDKNDYEWNPAQNNIQVSIPLYPSATVKFVARAPFTIPTGLDDDLAADCGLPETAQDIPEIAATAAHLRTMEGRRNQMIAQGDPRRAEEVTAGSNMSLARLYDLDLRNRIADERTLLNQRYPWTR